MNSDIERTYGEIGEISRGGVVSWATLTEEEAQILLKNILEKFHLDIIEILKDGEKVDYISTEGEHLEITVRTKEKPNV